MTRAYYARGDFDLILSSPAPAHRVFWARTGMVALTSGVAGGADDLALR